ncbi:MAG: hypothetical protein HDQ95_16260 [Roseburia sp.]|nr:hypothetical protein [Roseburia sp.]
MKSIILTIVSTILGVLTLMIVMTVSGRENRSTEIKSNLDSVVEETVSNMEASQKYSINNTNEFLADLVCNLVAELDSDSGIEVNILKCDKERGILSVRVTETFKHPIGKPGTVTCDRNVVLNKMPVDLPEQHNVIFFVGSDDYKSYYINDGECMEAPEEPVLEGKTFYGWKDVEGYLADFSQPVTEDMIYYADIR